MSSHHHHRHSSAFSTAADYRSTSSRSPSPSGNPSPVSPILSPGEDGLSRRHSWNRDRSEGINTSIANSETRLHPLASGSMSASHPPSHRVMDAREGYEEFDLGLPILPTSPYAQHQGGHGYPSETSLQSEGINSSNSDLDLAARVTGHRHGNTGDDDQQFLSPGPSSIPYSSPHRRPYDSTTGQAKSRLSGPSKLASSVGRSSTLRSVSRTLRNASVRVVNIMGKDRDEDAGDGGGLTKLPDDDGSGSFGRSTEDLKKDGGVEMRQTSAERPRPEAMPPEIVRLRGRTLGVFSSRSSIRRGMDSMMRSP